ncbi:MAG TPA: GNAT family N-acetyltransferase [Candidatus Baltobacteraceae bacterium]
MDDLTIRPGDARDRDFIQTLGRSTLRSSVAPFRFVTDAVLAASYERLLEVFYDQSHVALVARRGGEAVGFLLMLDELPDEVTMSPQAFIAYMAVVPAMRGQGVGKALLKAAEDEARRRGLPYIGLMVTEENVAARALYDSVGFRTERRLLCKTL